MPFINISIQTKNVFLKSALENILSGAPPPTLCDSQLLILDSLSTLDSAITLNHHICGCIIFIENEKHKNLFLQSHTNLPVTFININHEINYIRNIIPLVIKDMAKRRSCFSASHQLPEKLLPFREMEMLIMYGRGLSIAQIAEKMSLEKKTVLNYKKNAFKKLRIAEDIRSFNLLQCFSFLDSISKKNSLIVKKENVRCSFKALF